MSIGFRVPLSCSCYGTIDGYEGLGLMQVRVWNEGLGHRV